MISSQSGNVDKMVVHHKRNLQPPARFENSQKGGDLGKRGKIKGKKNERPIRFKNSQKGGSLGRRENIK